MLLVSSFIVGNIKRLCSRRLQMYMYDYCTYAQFSKRVLLLFSYSDPTFYSVHVRRYIVSARIWIMYIIIVVPSHRENIRNYSNNKRKCSLNCFYFLLLFQSIPREETAALTPSNVSWCLGISYHYLSNILPHSFQFNPLKYFRSHFITFY